MSLLKTIHKLLNLVLSFIAILLLPSFVSSNGIGLSNNPVCILIFVLLIYLGEKMPLTTQDRRSRFLALGLGAILSLLTAFGYQLEMNTLIWYSSPWLWLSIIFYSRVYAQLLLLIWKKLDAFRSNSGRIGEHKLQRFFDLLFNKPWVLPLIILICYIPCYLSVFPGGFHYDATGEFTQLSNGFSGDYPLLHSAIITTLLSLFNTICGSYNAGLMVYVLAQMMFVALLYSYMLRYFYYNKYRPSVVLISLLYAALFPNIHMLVTHSVRDVMFAVMLTCFLFLLYVLLDDTKAFLSSIRKCIALALVLAMTVLSRNSYIGLAALILIALICFALFLLCRKVNKKKALALSITCLAFYSIVLFSLDAIYKPSPPQIGNSLSMLIQQMCRAHRYEQDKWSEDDIQDFQSFIDERWLHYVPSNADPSKIALRLTEDRKAEFLRLWLRLGLKSKSCYIDAFFLNTEEMWFPGCLVNGYNESGLAYQDYEKSYFLFCDYAEEPIERVELLPKVQDFYERLGLFISFEKIPVISMLFSIGFQLWFLLNAFFYAVYTRRKSQYAPLMLLLLYMLITSLSPLVLLRYYSAVFIAMPMVIALLLSPDTVRD